MTTTEQSFYRQKKELLARSLKGALLQLAENGHLTTKNLTLINKTITKHNIETPALGDFGACGKSNYVEMWKTLFKIAVEFPLKAAGCIAKSSLTYGPTSGKFRFKLTPVAGRLDVTGIRSILLRQDVVMKRYRRSIYSAPPRKICINSLLKIILLHTPSEDYNNARRVAQRAADDINTMLNSNNCNRGSIHIGEIYGVDINYLTIELYPTSMYIPYRLCDRYSQYLKWFSVNTINNIIAYVKGIIALDTFLVELEKELMIDYERYKDIETVNIYKPVSVKKGNLSLEQALAEVLEQKEG